MKNNFLKKWGLVVFLLVHFSMGLWAQVNPFEKEIIAFAKSDSMVSPLQGKIVFVGSSSFTKWKDINQYFPGYAIINRGFGGSTLPDVIQYANETIIKYKPKQVIIYCGENDIASNDTITPAIVYKRFLILFNIIRSQLGHKTNIVFISLKPSILRWHLEAKMVQTNVLISAFLAKQSNTQFIDIHTPMLQYDGTVMKDIFIADHLHMNEKGYAIWQKQIAAHLLVK